MKKIIGVCLLLFSASLLARDFTNLIVQDLNLNYELPTGSATLSRVYFPNGNVDWNNPPNVEVIKDKGTLLLVNGREKFEFPKVPKFIENLNKAIIEEFNIYSEANKFELDFAKLDFISPEDRTLLKKAWGQCFESNFQDGYNLFDQLLEGCLTNGEVQAAHFNSESYKKSSSWKELLLPKHLSESGQNNQQNSNRARMDNIYVKIVDHAVNISARYVGDFSGNVRMRGMSWYLYEEARIKLRLDSASFGWFNIKEQIFAQLEKDDSGKIIVERPHVYILLK